MNKTSMIKAACLAGLSGKETEFNILRAIDNVRKAKIQVEEARLKLEIAKSELEILKIEKTKIKGELLTK